MDNKCTMDWNFGQFFFIMLSLVPSSILLSSWIVARFIWLPWVEKLKNMPELEVRYENRYLITDEDIEIHNENKDYKGLKDKWLLEKTPLGEVYIRYSADNEGFEYWCDVQLSYKYLETIARKYVKTFNCVDLYIDRRDMILEAIKKQRNKEKEAAEAAALEEKQREEGGEEEEENVFAKLKNYQKSKPKTRNSFCAEKANKYSYRGKLKERPKKEKIEENAKTNVSWSNWFTLNADDVHRIQGEDF
tara:strand:- start:187 stop:927 length:741 start_codon:yes stop_codon:yes gene_type:complete